MRYPDGERWLGRLYEEKSVSSPETHDLYDYEQYFFGILEEEDGGIILRQPFLSVHNSLGDNDAHQKQDIVIRFRPPYGGKNSLVDYEWLIEHLNQRIQCILLNEDGSKIKMSVIFVTYDKEGKPQTKSFTPVISQK